MLNDGRENSARPAEFAPEAPGTATATPVRAKFFAGADWVSFWLATLLALAVYLWTLAPDVTLSDSGMLSTGAMYAGVPIPPGYPVWTLYAWLFTKLLPFSNTAWRVAVSSAVAGALVCGLIALMVSCGGKLLLEGLRGFNRLPLGKDKRLRVVCGVVAGLGFGFDRWFWHETIRAATWSLSILTLCLTLVLLMRWFREPERRGFVYAASFVYGLALCNSQLLLAAAFGLQVIAMCSSAELRRDVCFANSIIFVGGLIANWTGVLPMLDRGTPGTNLLRLSFLLVGAGSIGLCAWLTLQTRRLLTEGRLVFGAGIMFLLGLMPHLYLPLASMTNPPTNWGYPRTVEGFWHCVTRGQYERLNPTCGFHRFGEQLAMFGDCATKDLGLFYAVIALIPFCLLHRMQNRERRWMFGLLAVFMCLTVLVVIVLNPPLDRQAREMVAPWFTPAHLVLAIWSGYGLTWLGAMLAREKTT